jgi:hypothetical protein
VVFGNNYQKPDLNFKDDTTKKSAEVKIEIKELEAAKAFTIK